MVDYRFLEIAAQAALSKIALEGAWTVQYSTAYNSHTASVLLNYSRLFVGMLSCLLPLCSTQDELRTAILAMPWQDFRAICFRSLYSYGIPPQYDGVQNASQSIVEAWRLVAANAVVRYDFGSVPSGGGGGGLTAEDLETVLDKYLWDSVADQAVTFGFAPEFPAVGIYREPDLY